MPPYFNYKKILIRVAVIFKCRIFKKRGLARNGDDVPSPSEMRKNLNDRIGVLDISQTDCRSVSRHPAA